MNRGFPSNCGCGAGITTFTSGTQENSGRPFFRCETRGEPKVEVHETELGKVKSEIKELMEIALNNKIKIQKNKVVIKGLVVYACIVTVVFGAYVLF
ncbi:hypothetical protein Bca52824_032445 [Brassica carinata]|uniref:Zinc finger GRF-type domain-containing protein n=1 Tax=Brassica carinata TaxID=52824 RepID=A0A8X7V676_BRACI|nr:hypothetical protein Bca52824_032445 [Brassica carinata]